MVALTLVLSGCGSAETPAPAKAPAGATLVATLGDSITAGSPLWDPEPGNRPPNADERSQFQFWAKAPNRAYRNCGVWGERTDEIAERYESCVAGAKVVIVQGGINDVVQGRPVAEAATDLRELVRRGKADGLRVLLTDVLPWNNGYPGAAEPIRELNGLIRAIATEEGVPLLEFFKTLDDPANPDSMRAELTTDGNHPNVAGHRLLGEVLLDGCADVC